MFGADLLCFECGTLFGIEHLAVLNIWDRFPSFPIYLYIKHVEACRRVLGSFIIEVVIQLAIF